MLDRLVEEELQADLGSAIIGREIIVVEQTSSTNDAILELAADSNDGLVLSPNTKPRGAASAAIDGNPRQGQDFGSRFFCDRGSTLRVHRN